MKKLVAIVMMLMLALVAAGCAQKPVETEAPTTQTPETQSTETQPATEPVTEALEAPTEEVYYVGASFNGYEAASKDYQMQKLEGYDDVYYLTVELTEENMDPTYEAHFYKVTNGTWDADGCWGAENYALQPAPADPNGAGLGSVYIKEHGTYTIYFNSTTKTVADTSFYTMLDPLPHIYGDFNDEMGRGADWSYADGLILSDDNFDGIYTGTFEIPAFAETEENTVGYSMAVALRYEFVEEWGAEGVTEQYKFDGTEAGMGGVSAYKPATDVTVTFSYNSVDHTTTIEEK